MKYHELCSWVSTHPAFSAAVNDDPFLIFSDGNRDRFHHAAARRIPVADLKIQVPAAQA
jgi:hypothetical protein